MIYEQIELTQRQDGTYEYIRALCRNGNYVGYQEARGHNEVLDFLEYIAYTQGMTVKQLYDSGKITFKTNVQNRGGGVFDSSNHFVRDIAKKVLTIATVGVITIGSFNLAKNFVVNRQSPYNNKYVVSMEYNDGYTKMEKSLKKVLNDYEDFDYVMKAVSADENITLSEKEFNKFLGQLDVISQANYGSISRYCNSNKNYKSSERYNLSLENYFNTNDSNYYALMEYEASNCLFPYYNSRPDYNDLISYIDHGLKYLYEDAGHKIQISPSGKTVYYYPNLISPVTKYIIASQLRSLIATTEFRFKQEYYIYDNRFTKEEVLNKLDHIIEYSISNMQSMFNVNQKNVGKR